VIVTALMTDPLAAAMHDLKRLGHRIVLVCIDESIDEVTVPAIRGLVVFHVDSDTIETPKPSRKHYATQMSPGSMPVAVDGTR
jgi:hypothetical protein